MGALASKGSAFSKAASVASSVHLKECTLWKSNRSPPCRAVMMALDALDLSVTEVDINLDKGEHRTTNMTMKNPLQSVPVFQDRELILHDSHAICEYLVNRYCNSGKILPIDAGGRAKVHQLMNYNGGVLYPRYRAAVDPILYEKCNFIMPQHVADIECAYADLETMLSDYAFFGNHCPNLADITLGATASTLHCLVPIDKLRYPRLSSWLYRLSEEPFYITANKKGLFEFTQRIDCGCCDENEVICPLTSARRRYIAATPNVKMRQFKTDNEVIGESRTKNVGDCT